MNSSNAVSMPSTLILSVGLNSALLNARNLILQSAGYIVTSASSLKDAVDSFLAGDFDLILLGHCIPANERERLTCLIRASGSLIPIISISEVSNHHDAFTDATLGNDQKVLLTGIQEALAKGAKTQETKAS